MDRSRRTQVSGALLVGALSVAALWVSSAEAAFVATPSGTTLSYSDYYLASAGSTASSPIYTTLTGIDYLLAVPGQYNFNHFFSAPQPNVLGTDVTASNYSFQDSYVFQVGAGAAGDTAVATLNLPPSFGMSDLQLRMYQIQPGTNTPVVAGSLTGNPAVVAVLKGWTGTPGPDSTQQIVADFTGLTTSGTYVLDIAGTATGNSGGQYYGALNLQPVPLPGAAWLLLSGAGALGFARKRKSA